MTVRSLMGASTSTMTRLRAPFDGPVWLPELVRSIEQAFRDAATSAPPVTATGTGSSQDIALPEGSLTVDDVLVFEAGVLRSGDYPISGRTLTLTATASAPIVIIKR